MLNIRNVVVDAFKMIGEIGDAEALDGTRSVVGLQLLNEQINQLNLDNYFAFTIQNVEFSPSASQLKYSIGVNNRAIPSTSATEINADRPSNIMRMYITESGSNTTNSEVEQVAPQDLALFKSDGGSIPQYFTYRSNYPLGEIEFSCKLATPYNVLSKRYGNPPEVVNDMKQLRDESYSAIKKNTHRKTPGVLHFTRNSLPNRNIINMGGW